MAKAADMLAEIRALREETAVSHQALASKVDIGFEHLHESFALHTREDDKRFHDLDKRLLPVEQARATVRAAIGAAFISFLGFLGSVAIVLWKGGVR